MRPGGSIGSIMRARSAGDMRLTVSNGGLWGGRHCRLFRFEPAPLKWGWWSRPNVATKVIL